MLLLAGLQYSTYFWMTLVILGFYAYLKFIVYTYWKRQGVPQETPKMPLSNALPVALGKISLGNHFKEIYDKFRQHRFNGFYMFYQPVLMINDPELIREILVKEFNKFQDRGFYHNEVVDPLTSSLSFLPGEKWRQLRAKLTPTFTSRKLKEMFWLIKEISDKLIKTTDMLINENNTIEVKDLISRYTTDSISSVVFGFNCDSLSDPENEFKRYGSLVFDNNPIKNILTAFVNDILDILHVPAFDRHITKFFSNTFDDMVGYRRKNNIIRKDFMNLLMQLMDNGVLEDDVSGKSNEDKLSAIQARAQAFIFFLAGFETSSSTITYLLYELALNPEIQEKSHHEIDDFFSNGEMTYDRVKNELKYLDMVLSETLRKHSSFAFLNRVCNADWSIPDSRVTIKRGTAILISVSGIHHDPKIYPDPEKFDPNRFSDENIASRSPYVYLPFGQGPRNCIGARFGITQSKMAVIAVLRNYKLHISNKTVLPLQYSKRSFTQSPGSGVYLRFEKRFTKLSTHAAS